VSVVSVECLETRDRLVDFVLAGLSEEETLAVSRHLEWCAACRKEVGELQDGIATVGWALEPAAAPPDLEERVVEAVAVAAGARVRERRRFRTVSAVAVATAVVAVVAASWAIALVSRVDQLRATQQRTEERAAQLAELVQAFGGQQIVSVRLGPTVGHAGGGQGWVVSSGGQASDWVLVVAGGLDSAAGPYRAFVVHDSGVELLVGTLVASHKEGQLSAYRFGFRQDLRAYHSLVVRDASGAIVLRGAVTAPGSA